MSEYIIYFTDAFKEVYNSIDKSEQQWINKIQKKLEENPTGKILQFSWFREKKYLNKRLYYLIDDNNKKILLVAFAPKKDQQKVIDFIKTNMRDYLDYLRRL